MAPCAALVMISLIGGTFSSSAPDRFSVNAIPVTIAKIGTTLDRLFIMRLSFFRKHGYRTGPSGTAMVSMGNAQPVTRKP